LSWHTLKEVLHSFIAHKKKKEEEANGKAFKMKSHLNLSQLGQTQDSLAFILYIFPFEAEQKKYKGKKSLAYCPPGRWPRVVHFFFLDTPLLNCASY
jgi:hypothetical protein